MNEKQQIVLDKFLHMSAEYDFSTILSELAFLPMTGGKMKYKDVATAWNSLSDIKQMEVVNRFCRWHIDNLELDKEMDHISKGISDE